MTTFINAPNNTQSREPDAPSIVPRPSGYRDGVRDTGRRAGTGYGRSSGYARDRAYADQRDASLFRCS